MPVIFNISVYTYEYTYLGLQCLFVCVSVSVCVVLGSEAALSPLYFRAVTESINQLISLCTQQAPGQKECDNALRELEVLAPSYLKPGAWSSALHFSPLISLITSHSLSVRPVSRALTRPSVLL